MAYNIMRDALEHTIKRRRRDKWMKAISGMAAVVVFCTTYALILPAITMEQEPVCGIEEHVHTDECYELPKELTCDSLQSKVTVVHHHDEFCYNAAGELICSLPEVEAHTHTDECYETIVPQEPHTHTDECWETTQICEIEEHTHTEECLDEEGNVVCGKEEHTHGEGCVEKKAVCGMTEATAEELAAYAEGTVTKLVCGKTEIIPHTHSDLCYDSEGHLVCGMKEVLVHQHSAECLTETTDPKAEPVLVCTKTEHEHTDECFNTADVESPIDWEITLPDIADKFAYADNLVAVAESQLGYHESVDNTKVGADGTIYGYTRYGQWAETPYGEWSLHFLDFCLHYAGIPAEAFPVHEGQARWSEQLKEENWNIYWTPAQYEEPVPGDIVYLDLNLDGKLDAAAIVKEFTAAVEAAEGQEAQKAVVIVIQGAVPGESSREVALMKYDVSDAVILGYASLDSAMTRYEIMNPAFGLEEEKEVEEAPAALYYCGQTEHTHGAACYDEENNLICEIPEHTHSDACAVPQPSYRCGLTEHEHDENCYDNKGEMICGLEEHEHDQTCIVYYICGQTAHQHTEECYDENGELTCKLEEHVHEDSCMLVWQTLVAQQTSGNPMLRLVARAASGTPSLSMSATGYTPPGASLNASETKATDLPAGTLPEISTDAFMCAFEISFQTANGPLTELLQPVTMQISGLELEADVQYYIYLIKDDSLYGDAIRPQVDITQGIITFDMAEICNFVVLTENDIDTDCKIPGCDIDDYLRKWSECSGTNPFGGAQDFNLFLLGDLNNWGDVHGNVAIMGNINGTSNMLSYDAGSNFDYAANTTQAYHIGLLLGGEQDASKHMTVSNGSVVLHPSEFNKFDVDPGDTVDHMHPVEPRETAPVQSLITDYFEKAKGSANTEGSLLWRNKETYEYATERLDEAHKGKSYTLGEYYDAFPMTDQEKSDISLVDWPLDQHFVLHGSNPFYNVFNIPYEIYSAYNGGSTRVYLDIPYGSYTIINLLPPDKTVDENGNVVDRTGPVPAGCTKKADGTWDVDSLSMQFRYKDSDGKYVQQPAKHGIDNYNQTQQTLVNFSPEIDSIKMPVGGDYLYASILGPTVDLQVTGSGVNLQGTIVLESLTAPENSPSSIIASPFMEGVQLDLDKQTVCDNGNKETCIHPDGMPCTICQANRDHRWDNFYADITLSSMPAAGGPETMGTKVGLPMNGDHLALNALAPGTYQLVNEIVYYKVPSGEHAGKCVTVDPYGNMMLVYYEQLNDVYWICRYCDGNLNVLDDLYNEDGEFDGTYDDLYKFAVAFPGVEFPITDHFWKYGALKHGEGKEQLMINVTPGLQTSFTVVNHYGLDSATAQSVYKTWGQVRTFTIKDENNQDKTEDRWVPIDAPEGAKIEVTLYRKHVEDPDSAYKAIPSTQAHPNPAVLEEKTDWFGVWMELEEIDEETNTEWEYKAVETLGYPGYTPKLTYNSTTRTWQLVNTYNPVTEGEITVNKEWFNSSGDKLEGEAVSDPTQFYSGITLMKREGELMDKNDPEVKKELRTAQFYLNDTTISNFLCAVDYFPGSDMSLVFNFWVKGTSAAGPAYGHMDELSVTANGKPLNYTASFGTHVVGSNVGIDYNTFYTPVTLTINADATKNLRNNLVIILHESAKDDRYPIIASMDEVGTNVAQQVQAPPAVSFTELLIPTKFVQWGDFVESKAEVRLEQQKDPVTGEQTWFDKWTGLELVGTGENEGKYYCYYVKESAKPDGYDPTFVYAQTGLTVEGHPGIIPDYPGITAGDVTVRNRPAAYAGDPLPMTGGIGTTPYTFGGLLAASAAFFLLQYNSKKRRKEDDPL